MKKVVSSASALAIAMMLAPGARAQAAPDKAGELEEIIVTAQKRPEVAQKAPLVVTSLSNEALQAAHVNSATDLQRVVPNLTAEAGGGAGDPGGASTLFAIRGLGASPTGPQGSTGVAVHFDGVFQQSGISSVEFYDLERVEVSPGPQGTLYGRSAAAGAVNVIPAKPADRTQAALAVGYGNYNALTTEGMLNLPANDKLALRVAFQTRKHDGYFSNGYDDQNAWSVRAQLLARPTDALTIRLGGQYVKLTGIGAGAAIVDGASFPGLKAVFPSAGNPDLRRASFSQDCVKVGAIVSTCQQSISVEKYTGWGEIDYDFGPANFTLVPAYTDTRRASVNAAAPLPFSSYNQQPYNNKQFNIEGRLSSKADSKIKWVIGTNYYDNTVHTFVDQFINSLIRIPVPPPAPPGTTVPGVVMVNAFQDQHSSQKSFAAFGQATIPLTDAVRLTLGGRYNHDRSTGSQVLGNTSVGVFILNGPGPIRAPGVPFLAAPGIRTPLQTGSQSFNAFTYRVAIDADLGPASIVYASVGSGYKPGGLNDGGPSSATTPANPLAPEQFFGPERVTHVEIGTKNRFLGNTLQINLAGYYDDYKNYQNGQTQVVNPLAFGALGFVVTNAGKARVYGLEGTAKWQATPHDVFEVAANYLDAKFTSYVSPAYLGPSGPVGAVDISGYALPNAPKFSVNLAYRHTFELGSLGQLVASAQSHISDGYWVYFAEAPGTYQSSYSATTLDLTWTSASKRVSASVYVSNLEDKDVKTFASYTAGYTALNLAPPRTFGGRIGVKF